MSGRCLRWVSVALVTLAWGFGACMGDGEPAPDPVPGQATIGQAASALEEAPAEPVPDIDPADWPPRTVDEARAVEVDPATQARAIAAVEAVQAEVDALEAIRSSLPAEAYAERITEARCRHYGCEPLPEPVDVESLEREARRARAYQLDVNVLGRDRWAMDEVEWLEAVESLYCEHFDCAGSDDETGEVAP